MCIRARNHSEDSEELQLTLCTGKVLMNFGEAQLKLTPGEQLVLAKTNMHLEREHVNTQNYMSVSYTHLDVYKRQRFI